MHTTLIIIIIINHNINNNIVIINIIIGIALNNALTGVRLQCGCLKRARGPTGAPCER